MIKSFSKKILAWYDAYGRQDLPWREVITPYRVWVSEIMLQQTQVTTVLPYFARFMAYFPDVESLAAAPQDAVLHLWSGLGYYSRARNLHKSAQIVMKEWQGAFPASPESLQSLPGIGRSTAGAIASIAFEQPSPILDGNVKRVLARVFAVPGWPGETPVAKHLWSLAATHTPQQRPGDYAQAMMDLGAMVCTRTKPKCNLCPVATDCGAYQQGQMTSFPGKKPTKEKPVRATQFLMLEKCSGELLMNRRPESGIWGGLYCFPECPQDEDAFAWCKAQFGFTPKSIETLVSFRHTFTHYHLDITPLRIPLPARLPKKLSQSIENTQGLWYKPGETKPLGLPAPVTTLLQNLELTPT